MLKKLNVQHFFTAEVEAESTGNFCPSFLEKERETAQRGGYYLYADIVP